MAGRQGATLMLGQWPITCAWIAVGDEIADQAVWRAIDQVRAVAGAHVSACRQDERMSRCHIPIVRRPQPRIEVGASFRDAAKFD